MNKKSTNAKATIDYTLLSQIVHDSKSPFNGLIGFSDLLVSNFDKLPDDNKREYNAIIHQLALKSYLHLQTLLTWVKLISDNITLNYTVDSSDNAIEQAIAFVRSDIDAKNITLNLPSDTIDLSADQNLLSIALATILSLASRTVDNTNIIDIHNIALSQTRQIIISWNHNIDSSNEMDTLFVKPNESYNEYNYRGWIAQQIMLAHQHELLYSIAAGKISIVFTLNSKSI